MTASAATAAARASWRVSAGNFIFHWRNAMFPVAFLAVAAAAIAGYATARTLKKQGRL